MDQHIGGLDADPDDAHEHPEQGLGSVRRRLAQPLQAHPVDLFDLLFDQLQASHIAAQFGHGVGRRYDPLWGAQGRQPLCCPAQMRLEIADTEARRSALNGHAGESRRRPRRT